MLLTSFEVDLKLLAVYNRNEESEKRRWETKKCEFFFNFKDKTSVENISFH